jgi:hypothetical protein
MAAVAAAAAIIEKDEKRRRGGAGEKRKGGGPGSKGFHPHATTALSLVAGANVDGVTQHQQQQVDKLFRLFLPYMYLFSFFSRDSSMYIHPDFLLFDSVADSLNK